MPDEEALRARMMLDQEARAAAEIASALVFEAEEADPPNENRASLRQPGIQEGPNGVLGHEVP